MLFQRKTEGKGYCRENCLGQDAFNFLQLMVSAIVSRPFLFIQGASPQGKNNKSQEIHGEVREKTIKALLSRGLR